MSPLNLASCSAVDFIALPMCVIDLILSEEQWCDVNTVWYEPIYPLILDTVNALCAKTASPHRLCSPKFKWFPILASNCFCVTSGNFQKFTIRRLERSFYKYSLTWKVFWSFLFSFNKLPAYKPVIQNPDQFQEVHGCWVSLEFCFLRICGYAWTLFSAEIICSTWGKYNFGCNYSIMPMDNLVGELAVLSNKGKKEKVSSNFHPWGRILEKNNDSGHWWLTGRDLGWSDLLKQIFMTGYTLCPFSVYSGQLSVTLLHGETERAGIKTPVCGLEDIHSLIHLRNPFSQALRWATVHAQRSICRF